VKTVVIEFSAMIYDHQQIFFFFFFVLKKKIKKKKTFFTLGNVYSTIASGAEQTTETKSSN